MIKFSNVYLLIILSISSIGCKEEAKEQTNQKRPNILFVISDDHSYPHTSAYGYKTIRTPGFDRVAREGVLFNNCFTSSPGCAPARATLLTGRHQWQLEATGVHAGIFLKKYITYPDILEKAGYHVGSTGKGWGPGNFKEGGRKTNPAGKSYWYEENLLRYTPSTVPIPKTEEDWQHLNKTSYSVSNQNYARNFENFLETNTEDKPFCFWYGAFEPHRTYRKGSGIEIGLKMSKIEVPDFLPDVPEVRQDFLDYMYEIMWFDAHLERMLTLLEKKGLLDNTLVIVTADNGMPFPRAKANVYEYGIHMPLAISWGNKIPKGRKVDDLVSFADFAPTILELVDIEVPKTEYAMVGKSFANLLLSKKQGLLEPSRDAVYSSREQHAHARHGDAGYPQRAIRTHEYLYIRNYKPNRWPAGQPHVINENGELELELRGFYDIDDFHMDYIWLNRENPDVKPFFELAVAKRPYEELYNIKEGDDACLKNLVNNPNYSEVLGNLRNKMDNYLVASKDPRAIGNGDILESYRKRNNLNFPIPEN